MIEPEIKTMFSYIKKDASDLRMAPTITKLTSEDLVHDEIEDLTGQELRRLYAGNDDPTIHYCVSSNINFMMPKGFSIEIFGNKYLKSIAVILSRRGVASEDVEGCKYTRLINENSLNIHQWKSSYLDYVRLIAGYTAKMYNQFYAEDRLQNGVKIWMLITRYLAEVVEINERSPKEKSKMH